MEKEIEFENTNWLEKEAHNSIGETMHSFGN